MLKRNQVLVVLTLYVTVYVSALGPPVDVGPPAPVETSDKCKKDLLLIIDTSSSIREKNFKTNVKPFLVNFIKHPHLNVHEHGTRIAIILFSSTPRTKILLEFNKEYDAEMIAEKIRNLKWKDVVGYATRTSKAFDIADTMVFKKNNPDNVRPGIQDVILLVTDGAPTDYRKSVKNSQKLKDKKIVIVGAAIGPKRNQFLPKLEKLVTKGHVVKANFNNLDNVMDTIIAKSCVRPATCHCPITGAASLRPEPGQSKAIFNWPEPELSCEKGAPAVTNKVSTFTSPHAFPVGRHTIMYYYTMQNGMKLSCPIVVSVEAICHCPTTKAASLRIQPGQSKAIFKWPEPQLNCEQGAPGVANNVSTFTSPHAFPVGQHTIMYNYTMKDGAKLSCAIVVRVQASCHCPITESAFLRTRPGQSKAIFKWPEPQLNCGKGAPGVANKVSTFTSPHAFPVGQHTITYNYTMQDGAKLSCAIRVVRVQASCYCPITGAASVRLQAGQSKAIYKWREPQLNCGKGAPGVADKVSTFTSPHAFPIGQHTIMYNYTMKDGGKLSCVFRVVRVQDAMCGGEAFNSKTQVCCCGEVHTKQNGNECCGKFYYDKRLEKCCDVYANRVAIGESC